jgi:undecaprenyl-diphosphatase
MIDWLDQIDRNLFLYFNGFYSNFSDQVWIWLTYAPTWIPLYVLLFYFFIKVFKKEGFYMIAGLLLVVLACDQFTSTFMKPYFARWRPCHDPVIGHLVHVAEGCGGQFGFASSHSANSFGIAMFAFMVFRHFWRWTWLMFVWAAVVAFSRIMVGVHYPGDILVGGILGIVFGWLIFKALNEIYFRIKLKPIIKN